MRTVSHLDVPDMTLVRLIQPSDGQQIHNLALLQS